MKQMTQMTQKIVLTLAALLLAPLASLHAATQAIENSTLSVTYDNVSGRFTVAEKKQEKYS